MKNRSESKLVRDIIGLVLNKHFPGFYFKTHGGLYQIVGLPDIIGCYQGKFIGIEVKLPGKESTLTIKQAKTLNNIGSCGGVAFMTTSLSHTYLKMKGIKKTNGKFKNNVRKKNTST